MTVYYCTSDQVADFMRVDRWTGDNKTKVEALINNNESVIDARLMRGFRAIAVTNEVHDIGPGQRDWNRGLRIDFNYRPVATDPAPVIEYFSGTSWTNLGTEGTDYYIDYDTGSLYKRGWWPWTSTKMAIRFSYSYGESSVPGWVTKMCIMMTAVDIVNSEKKWNVLAEGADRVGMRQMIEDWRTDIDTLIQEQTEPVLLVP